MRLIVGLGNPGARYERTRHNIGFMAVDAIVRRHALGPFRPRFKGEFTEGTIAGSKIMLLKPQTFMNDSGEAVGAAARFFKLDPGEVAVIHDELDLKEGKLRVKRGGGAAGHNGLRSIDALFANDYWRVRIGIGHPGAKELVLHYVLQNFPAEELDWVRPLLDAVAEAAPLLVADDAPGFMSKVALLTRPAASSEAKEGPR
ncbi:MAG TPA: aminoacyl-tRNA hydrolase [Stellaceae bacterium]|nr:aminoacyl-tRNA hydrolase [Stellaceae bacterium]